MGAVIKFKPKRGTFYLGELVLPTPITEEETQWRRKLEMAWLTYARAELDLEQMKDDYLKMVSQAQ
ncbi:MAG: hypothetical protein WA056_01585 [Gallionella sp.]